MSHILYGVAWLEWKDPLGPTEKPDPKAPKKRLSKLFRSEREREEYLDEQVDRDDFLYVLSKWEEQVLI